MGSACSGDAPPGTGVNGSCHLAAYKLHTHDHLFFSSSQPMRKPTTAERSARLMPAEPSAMWLWLAGLVWRNGEPMSGGREKCQQADPPAPWGDPADPKIETNFTSYVWAYEWEE